MTDKSSEEDEEYRLFNILMEMWDSCKLIDFMRAEYQRGRDDYRDELLAKMDTVSKQMLEVHTASKQELDRKAAEPITHDQDHKPLIAKSIEEVKAQEPKVPAEPEPDPPKCICEGGRIEGLSHHPDCPRYRPLLEPGTLVTDNRGYNGRVDEEGVIRTLDTPDPEKRTSEAPKPRKRPSRTGIRGDTSVPQPKGIPTTFEMVAIVLDEKPGLPAKEVVDQIRDRWWPGLQFGRVGPEISTWVGKGRLSRNADGGLTVSEGGRKLAAKAIEFARRPAILPASPPNIQMPAVQPTAGPRPREVVTPGAKLGAPARHQNEEEFEHMGRKILLSSREYLLAVRLRAAIGKGHIGAQFLAETGLGIKRPSDSETLIRDIVDVMNPKIEQLKLRVDFYRGFGFLMKEI